MNILPTTKFLCATDIEPPQITILGVPFDFTTTFRDGARFAPQRIREVSQSLETYSPNLSADLSKKHINDLGDLLVSSLKPQRMLEAVRNTLTSISSPLIILLGGEHTITLGAIRALKPSQPQLLLIQFDAHLDLRDQYENQKISHATISRRIFEELGPTSIIQLGIRSGTASEFEFAKSNNIISTSKVTKDILKLTKGRPIYLNIDMDILDPSVAPGVSNPEPGGYSFNDLMDALYALRGAKMIGLDIVEVSPPHDPSDITSTAAAKIIREAILLFTS